MASADTWLRQRVRKALGHLEFKHKKCTSGNLDVAIFGVGKVGKLSKAIQTCSGAILFIRDDGKRNEVAIFCHASINVVLWKLLLHSSNYQNLKEVFFAGNLVISILLRL